MYGGTVLVADGVGRRRRAEEAMNITVKNFTEMAAQAARQKGCLDIVKVAVRDDQGNAVKQEHWVLKGTVALDDADRSLHPVVGRHGRQLLRRQATHPGPMMTRASER